MAELRPLMKYSIRGKRWDDVHSEPGALFRSIFKVASYSLNCCFLFIVPNMSDNLSKVICHDGSVRLLLDRISFVLRRNQNFQMILQILTGIDTHDATSNSLIHEMRLENDRKSYVGLDDMTCVKEYDFVAGENIFFMVSFLRQRSNIECHGTID